MSSPLMDLKKTFQPSDIYRIGIMGENSTVTLANGVIISVFGSATIGDTVLLKNNQIISIVKKTDTIIQYVR